jgi:GNAT superfamily N-acetyltransferase
VLTLSTEVRIRSLQHDDPNVISAAFTAIGSHKPASQYLLYLAEQATGRRVVLVATLAGVFVGYTTLVWQPRYAYFRDRGIPEIQDLNVLPPYRRRGIATRLVTMAERIASACTPAIGIGVGLHPGYNAAQRMYVLRGYVPDGQGVAYDGRYVAEGERVIFDDHLALYLTKSLRPDSSFGDR